MRYFVKWALILLMMLYILSGLLACLVALYCLWSIFSNALLLSQALKGIAESVLIATISFGIADILADTITI